MITSGAFPMLLDGTSPLTMFDAEEEASRSEIPEVTEELANETGDWAGVDM